MEVSSNIQHEIYNRSLGLNRISKTHISKVQTKPSLLGPAFNFDKKKASSFKHKRSLSSSSYKSKLSGSESSLKSIFSQNHAKLQYVLNHEKLSSFIPPQQSFSRPDKIPGIKGNSQYLFNKPSATYYNSQFHTINDQHFIQKNQLYYPNTYNSTFLSSNNENQNIQGLQSCEQHSLSKAEPENPVMPVDSETLAVSVMLYYYYYYYYSMLYLAQTPAYYSYYNNSSLPAPASDLINKDQTSIPIAEKNAGQPDVGVKARSGSECISMETLTNSNVKLSFQHQHQQQHQQQQRQPLQPQHIPKQQHPRHQPQKVTIATPMGSTPAKSGNYNNKCLPEDKNAEFISKISSTRVNKDSFSISSSSSDDEENTFPAIIQKPHFLSSKKSHENSLSSTLVGDQNPIIPSTFCPSSSSASSFFPPSPPSSSGPTSNKYFTTFQNSSSQKEITSEPHQDPQLSKLYLQSLESSSKEISTPNIISPKEQICSHSHSSSSSSILKSEMGKSFSHRLSPSSKVCIFYKVSFNFIFLY